MSSSTEIVKRPVVQLIKDSASDFAKRLPATMDANRWAMQLATALQKNPDLQQCTPQSIILAAYDAAELGISLSPALAHGYLVRFKDQCVFIVGYRGLIQKVHGAGTVKALFAEVVYGHDQFSRQFAPKRNLFHAPADGERGEPVGAYACVEYVDGTIDFEYMTAEQIGRRRKHSRAPDSMMWTTFWEEAWRKTPIRAMFKRIPLANPGLERLAEYVEKEAQLEEPEPAGRLEFEDVPFVPGLKKTGEISAEPAQSPTSESPCAPGLSPRETAPVRESEGNMEIFFEVGRKITIVSGRTILLKDDLPKVGAKWDSDARVWRMPAARTDELLAVCQEKQIPAAEVGAKG
jgi:recombination protein RecT